MSADTGVGPSIASGSQVCSGNWADLPITPTSSSSAAAVSVVVPSDSSVRGRSSTLMDVVPLATQSTMIAQHEADVADPGDQERLDRSRPGGLRARSRAPPAGRSTGP